MNITLFQALKSARLASGLKQVDVADQLGVRDSTLSGWETGRTEPDIDTLIQMCTIYGIDCAALLEQVYGKKESKMPLPWHAPLDEAYERAIEPTQQVVCKVLDIPHVKPHTPARPREKRVDMLVFVYPAAAGAPSYIESDYDRLSFRESDIPDCADYGVRITGSSMEPGICDGDIVWVHQTPDISDGQVGVFRLLDDAVCKRARTNERGLITRLESDNPVYDDIEGRALEDLYVIGRVVGVSREE